MCGSDNKGHWCVILIQNIFSDATPKLYKQIYLTGHYEGDLFKAVVTLTERR